MKANFDLDPAQWSRLRGLLDDALALAPAERATWIDDLGPQDEALKPRLRALLAHEGPSPLDTLPCVETAQFLAERARHGDAAFAPGAALGPYRLIRALGAGGMGEVWLAERTDMLNRRPVALKLPRLFTERAALAQRLVREREILAALNHPNIARLYDAGLTADGQPYLALEYVDGERVDAYCARKALDVPARLRLFLQVARAVAHAHAQLVVHRDLKPANILVTEAGEVKLLDFGIAKLLEDGRAHETELTQLAGRALTPDYAAPEQILGQPLGTAADVYALGVVLFELLTGTRPYRLKRESRAALEEAIVTAEPVRPSAVTSEPKLKRRLRGDLDTIVLKALKKVPAERYGTVEALAEDIERHLAQRPVRAQPDSRTYRLRKFVVRNGLAVGASAAVLLAILAGAGAAVWQARVALAEKQRAEAVKDFIASVFGEVNPFALSSGKPVSAVDLLGNALQRIDRELGTAPATRAELLTVVGASLAGLGEFQRAADVLARATAEWSAVARAEDSRLLRAQLQWADAEHQLGRHAAARDRLATVVRLLESTGRTESEEYVRAKIAEASFEFNEGRFGSERAHAAARTAVDISRRVLGERNALTIVAFNTAAVAHRWRNETAAAVHYAEKAHRAALAVFGDDGKHARTIQMENEYGRALAQVGRLKEGVEHMKAAARRAGDAYGANHVMVQHYKGTLAAVQLDYGDIREAIENLAAATAQDVGSAKLSLSYQASQATAQGRALLVARRPSDAIGRYETALTLFGKAGARGTLWLSAEAEHALALAQVGRIDDAAARLDRMVDERRGSGNTGELQVALRHLAYARSLQSRQDEALALLGEAIVLLEKITAAPAARASHRLALADALRDRGLAQLATGAAHDALQSLDAARERYAALQGPVSPNHADALVGSGRARLQLGRAMDGLPLLEQADAFWRDFDPDNRWAGEAAFWLARCYQALGRGADAKAAYARAARLLARSPLPGDAQLAQQARSRAAAIRTMS